MADGDPEVPRFVEIAGAAGLQHQFNGGTTFHVGGGAAAFDCDNDKDADLFLAGGQAPAALFRNLTEPGAPLRFKKASEQLGLDSADIRDVSGAYPVDFDNDGDLDLFVMRFGKNRLLENDGNCRFSVADDKAGLPDTDGRTTAFAAAWINGSARPTFYVGNYTRPSPEADERDICDESYFFHAGGVGGASEDAYRPISPSLCPLSYLPVDWSGRGRFDLRVANDLMKLDGEVGSGQLFKMEENATSFAKDQGWRDTRFAATGLAARDIDGDGLAEIAAASRTGSRFYVIKGEPGGPDYIDQADERGLAGEIGNGESGPASGSGWASGSSWHVEFSDFNNDSVSDLLVVRGQREKPADGSPSDHDMLFLGRPDGSFANRAQPAGLALPTVGRGAAIADFDRDGCQDVVVVNRDSPVSLFRNRHCDGEDRPGWLEVELEQDGANRRAVGASIILRAGAHVQTQARTVGGGHAGGTMASLHFGLGDSDEAILRVRWPDGSITDPITIPANRFATIRRSGQTITVNMGE